MFFALIVAVVLVLGSVTIIAVLNAVLYRLKDNKQLQAGVCDFAWGTVIAAVVMALIHGFTFQALLGMPIIALMVIFSFRSVRQVPGKARVLGCREHAEELRLQYERHFSISKSEEDRSI